MTPNSSLPLAVPGRRGRSLWAAAAILAASALVASAPAKPRSPAFERAAQSLVEGASPGQLSGEAAAFLADSESSEYGRFKIRSLQKHLGIRAKGPLGRHALMNELEAAAEELIEEFPSEPASYGLLLSVAKGSDHSDSVRIARRLLDSPADEELKGSALRLLAQGELRYKQAAAKGISFRKYQGRAVVLYSWDAETPPFRGILNAAGLPRDSFAFVGVYLGADPARGRAAARKLGLPGRQYCDGQGLEGPLAQSLALLSPASVYLIDSSGRLFDTEGQRDFGTKIASLVGSPLARPGSGEVER